MMKRMLSAVLALVLICTLLPLKAQAIGSMSASDEILDFIKNLEGYHAIPYWDYSQWTVGFGNMCPEGDLLRYMEEGIPVEEAEALLQKNVEYFDREINKFIVRKNLTLTQQQYDAIFSLTFNIGTSWLYKSDHSVVQAIVNGQEGNEFIYQMGLRCNAGGQFQFGLLKRRLMEADLYLNGRYNTVMPADYAVVYYDSGEGSCEAKAQGYDLNLPAQPLAVPTYEGYTFLGWYTQPVGGVRVSALDAGTDGITLYAHWEKVGITNNLPGTPIDATVVTVTTQMLNIRTGPGTTYAVAACVSKGAQLTITATALRNGVTWGKCSQGWLSLVYTDYPQNLNKEETEDTTPDVTLPVDATVMNDATVYNGPHTSYPQIGELTQGQQIRVLALKKFMGKLWARFEGGWVQAERDLQLHDESYLTHPFVATLTNSYLNVRSGPGTSYTLAGTLNQGDAVQILAVKMADGTVWGRCYQGWISLRYTDFDQSMLPRYQKHTYGEWYDVTAASCDKPGRQRSDCLDCDHFETRSTTAQHDFDPWYEVVAPTHLEQGQQRRDCRNCEHYETMETPCLSQPDMHIFGTVTGCDALNVRSAAGAGNAWVGSLKRGDRVEILEQLTMDGKLWGRCSKGWFCITGYVTLDVASEEAPQEPEAPADTLYGVLTGSSTLNIRTAAGTEYAIVGVLKQGQRVQILEQQSVGQKIWGRIDQGWICLTGYVTLETETDSGETKQVMTVTAYSLNVRAGAGSQHKVVGVVTLGQQVEVLETKTVDGKLWARIAQGWVSMLYLQ